MYRSGDTDSGNAAAVFAVVAFCTPELYTCGEEGEGKKENHLLLQVDESCISGLLRYFVFNGNTGSGQHSLYPAAEISVLFESGFIHGLVRIQKLQPALCFDTFLTGYFEFGQHIGQALGILRLGYIGKYTGGGLLDLKNNIGIAFVI